MAKETSSEQRDKTPVSWNGPDDARNDETEFPNYDVEKTRSGHNIVYNDTKGKESMTWQHRTGSMLQFLPDGAIQLVAHKGQYNMVFGESRTKITGAQDTTVDGDVSIKAKKDYNSTVYGNQTSSIKGESTISAKTENKTIAEQAHMAAGEMTTKTRSGFSVQAGGGAVMVSKGGMAIGSTSDAVAIGGAGGIGMKSGKGISFESQGQMSISTQGNMVAIDGAVIHINSGKSQPASSETNMSKTDQAPSEQKFDVA
jgi:hypothetical protein